MPKKITAKYWLLLSVMTTPDSALVVGRNVTGANPMQDGTNVTTVEKIKSGEQRNCSSI